MSTATRPTSRKVSIWILLLGVACSSWAFVQSLPGGGRHGGVSSSFPSFGLVRSASAAPADTQTNLERSSLAQRTALFDELGVSAWHAAGHLGRGVKVAILDTGFRGYRDFLGKVLPAKVTTHSFRADGNLEARDSQHGILCSEVVHSIAPDAELLFANWETDRPETFLAAVRWARQQGARIISCSVIMPSWSDGAGHGDNHCLLKETLGDGRNRDDLLCFASAGNTAQRHWQGVFKDNGDRLHDWSDGVTRNSVRPWGGERVSVEMYGSGAAGYELTVLDETSERRIDVARFKETQGFRSAAIHFMPESGHVYAAQVRLLEGPADEFHLVVLGGTLDHGREEGSVPFPADGNEVIAVGAVGRDGMRMAYSSRGADAGKPDLVAKVPFSSTWRDRSFSGTSAASPQAAGLAALIWSKHADWTAEQVKQALFRATREVSGARNEIGHGLIHLGID